MRRRTSSSGRRFSFPAASRRTRGSRRSKSSRASFLSRTTSASRSSRTSRTRSTTKRTGMSRRETVKASRSRATRPRVPRRQAPPGRLRRAPRVPTAQAASTATCRGARADDYRPFKAGKLIPANSDISIPGPLHADRQGRRRPSAHRLHRRGVGAREALDVVRHRRRRAELCHSAERLELQESRRSISSSRPTSISSR